MEPIQFPGVNRIYAEDQPEYLPLPVMAMPGPEGEVYSCWKLTPEEAAEVAHTGVIYIKQLTFNGPLQPLLPLTKLDDGIEFTNG